MLLGCIGDDFTGSSDIANTLARRGMVVTQYSGVPSAPARSGVEAGVVSLKTRTMPPAEAIAASLRALDWLEEQGCQQFLFKYCSTFDSTPEGNIGPVTEALANRLGADFVVMCPAFPETGRTVYQGHLFVHDRLLNESGMENHPLTPMTDADIRRWLRRQTEAPIGHVAISSVREGSDSIRQALRGMAENGKRLIVVDATTDSDLIAIGHAADGMRLITGGSGIAMGLPDNFRRNGALSGAKSAWHGVSGPCAILAGSSSRQTRAQVAYHRARHPALAIDVDQVMDGSTTGESVADWIMRQDGLPLAYATAEPEVVQKVQERHGRERAAAALEDLFADAARRIVAKGAKRLVAAGGETSGAIVEGLEIDALEIGPEIAPGAPALRSGDLALALKSGNFGEENFFEKAAQMLEAV